MERALKVITLDLKRRKFISGLIISSLGMFCISILDYRLSTFIGKTEKNMIPNGMLHLIPYIILVICSFSLNQEFSNKTDKMIFTGILSRSEIMISKLISFMTGSIICFLFYEIAAVVGGIFELRLMFNSLFTFLIYSFTLGSFILLVSVITSNFIITGIIAYVLHFDLILMLFSQALVSSKNEMIKLIIPKLPFYIANTGFYLGKYTVIQSIIMLGCGILFFGITCVIINRKNI